MDEVPAEVILYERLMCDGKSFPIPVSRARITCTAGDSGSLILYFTLTCPSHTPSHAAPFGVKSTLAAGCTVPAEDVRYRLTELGPWSSALAAMQHRYEGHRRDCGQGRIWYTTVIPYQSVGHLHCLPPKWWEATRTG